MTDEAKVKEIYPDAHESYDGATYWVWQSREIPKTCLGAGGNAPFAWRQAFRQLPKLPKPTPPTETQNRSIVAGVDYPAKTGALLVPRLVDEVKEIVMYTNSETGDLHEVSFSKWYELLAPPLPAPTPTERVTEVQQEFVETGAREIVLSELEGTGLTPEFVNDALDCAGHSVIRDSIMLGIAERIAERLVAAIAPSPAPAEAQANLRHAYIKAKLFIRSLYENERTKVGIRETANELLKEIEEAEYAAVATQ